MNKILFLFCIFVANTSNATTVRSTLTLNTPYTEVSPNFDTIVFDWSTLLTSGEVSREDVTNWKMTLFSGTTEVYQDTIVSNNVINSIGGVERYANSFNFRFDLDSSHLINFDNINQGHRLGNSVGDQYNVYMSSPSAQVGIYQNGYTSSLKHISYTAINSNISSVPVPAAVWLFGSGLMGLLVARKKAKLSVLSA